MDVCLLGGHVVNLEGCGHWSDHTHTHTLVSRPSQALVIVICSGEDLTLGFTRMGPKELGTGLVHW